MAKSAGNVFPAEFAQKSVGKSAEKTKNSSNKWTCYKESQSWVWTLAQASWGGSAAGHKKETALTYQFFFSSEN